VALAFPLPSGEGQGEGTGSEQVWQHSEAELWPTEGWILSEEYDTSDATVWRTPARVLYGSFRVVMQRPQER